MTSAGKTSTMFCAFFCGFSADTSPRSGAVTVTPDTWVRARSMTTRLPCFNLTVCLSSPKLT